MMGPSFRWLPLWFAALALWSCGGAEDPPINEPKGCATECAANQACTTAGVCACEPGFLDCDGVASNGCEHQGSECEAGCTAESDTSFCERHGKECGEFTGTDNCGESRTAACGSCPDGSTCGLKTPNVCGEDEECVGESEAVLCAALGKNCGTLETDDRCDERRTIDCGSCAEGDVCGLVTDNVCGTPDPQCEPETTEAFCQRLGLNCGTVSGMDNCDEQRTVSCGTCQDGEICGAKTPNVCGPDETCEAEADEAFCSRHGKNCGPFSGVDNCGQARTAVCGACGEDETCGVTTPFVCGPTPCEPEPVQALCQGLGKNCGTVTATDRCGDTRDIQCGTCLTGHICGSVEPNVCGPDTSCVPEDDASLCASMGMNCGSVNAPDNCGTFRTVACGTCADDERCGLVETNVCSSCIETDQQFCHRNGKFCGNFTGTDLCGERRSVQCGGCTAGSVCAANACVPTTAPVLNESCMPTPGSFVTCAQGLSCIINSSTNPTISGCKQICASDAECMFGTCAAGVLDDGRGICGTELEFGDPCENFFTSDDICTPNPTTECNDGFCGPR